MVDATDGLDPQLAAVVEDVEAMGLPPWHAMSVSVARQVEDELFSSDKATAVETVRDLAIDGPAGGIPIRLYRPAVADPPTLVFYHGGGWVLGTLDSADNICRELAVRAGCLVVSIDYRLAPEHPFPAAVDDSYAGLEWTIEYADSLGGDPSRLGVAGTSAGGNLAAATALRARDGGPVIDGQFLLYPIIDPMQDTDSYQEHGDGPLLTREDMAWFWELYLRSPVDAHNPFAAPSRASDLAEVAPAMVVTAGFDVLRDEGATYADQLAAAGVPTDHDHYPTLAHGFLSLTADVDAADAAMDDVARRIRERLG